MLGINITYESNNCRKQLKEEMSCSINRKNKGEPQGDATKKLRVEVAKLLVELEKARKKNEELNRELAKVKGKDDKFCPKRSSTMNEEQSSANETFLASLNQMSMSSLNVPECKPTTGETEIDKRSYDHWKKVLDASMNLIQAVDEDTKYNMFRIKSGPLLLELLEGTTTQEGMPDEKLKPYSNAVARLDAYFGSRAYILAQRSKLANMVQKTSEENIEYVKRVAAASKLCNFKTDEEFEAISRAVTRGSTDSRVRTLAYRVLTDGGTYNDFVDRVRNREVERQIENDYRQLHQQRAAVLAPISQRPRSQYSATRGYSSIRGRGAASSTMRYQKTAKSCYRCLSAYHSPSECFHIEKVCRNCNKRGHLERACSIQQKQETRKRHLSDIESEPPSKIATATKTEEGKVQVNVMESDNE